MPESDRHAHHGEPFTDDDAQIAAMLADVSVPVLLCSMVHLTGDPAWIRSELRPSGVLLNEYQGFMSPEAQAAARQWVLPALAAHRDARCPTPAPLSPALITEMMSFLACGPLPDDAVPMFAEDLQLDGPRWADTRWAEAVPVPRRAEYPVLIVGCGEAGLLAGIVLRQAGIPFTILEKNPGVGGTWFENTYPGARVDIGSHFYSFSADPGEHWSEYFVQHDELRRSFEREFARHGLAEHTRFETEVTAARWDEDAAAWTVTARRSDGTVEQHSARILISAVGSLNRPRLPEIEGMDAFTGPAFHSARWDHGVDLTAKRVALIGAGASGFQIGPAIAGQVEQLTVFQRTAQWMFPNPHYHEQVPAGDRWARRHLPYYGRWFRFLTFMPGSGMNTERIRIDPTYTDDGEGIAINAANRAAHEFFSGWIRSQVHDPELLAKVLPDYPASGKRTLQDNGSWLACLQRDNVELVRRGIAQITPDGVLDDDGRVHPADVIIYATGFRHNDFLYPMSVTGRGPEDLRTQWGDAPSAYLGITVHGFPNLFCLYGPGTNLSLGSNLIYQSECQMRYVLDCLRELIVRGQRAMDVRAATHRAYQDRYDAEMAQMVWSHPAIKHSHYKNPSGKVYTLSPWPVPDYWRWTHRCEAGDYEFSG